VCSKRLTTSLPLEVNQAIILRVSIGAYAFATRSSPSFPIPVLIAERILGGNVLDIPLFLDDLAGPLDQGLAEQAGLIFPPM
jgi:hypothetical protein